MILITVIGESVATPENYCVAEKVGELIGKCGAVLISGGREGVMEAACRGAKKAGGMTIGILPGSKKEDGNKYVDIPILTGMGYARNKIVVKTGQAIIAIGGGYGTLSEIGFALGYNIPVIGLNTWEFFKHGKTKDTKIIHVATPEEAVERALELIKNPPKITPKGKD